MKINKKHSVISILVAALMVFAMTPITEVTVFAADTITEGGITYTLDDENQTAVISGHTDDLPADITIPAIVNNSYKVTAVGNSAFWNTRLESVTFETGSNLTSIGESAFASCYGITAITIPASVTSIGDSAFWNTGLETVTFAPNTELKTIGQGAFSACTSLKDITIPKSVTSLGDSAFAASGLESVTFEAGSSLQSIEESVFRNCRNLSAITIPKSVTNLEQDAFANTGLASVTFETGSRLEVIGYNALGSCGNLKTITIPASVTSIGEQAFSWGGLQSIIFEPGSRLETIGNNAFARTNLNLIHYLDEEAAWNRVTKPEGGANPDPAVHFVTSTTTKKATPDAGGYIDRYICDKDGCGDWEYGGTVISKPKEFILSETSYTFDGTEKKPEVIVKDADGNTIAESNYDVEYFDNTNVGTATAEVTFKGDKYEGSKSVAFSIYKEATVPEGKTLTYNGKAQTGVEAGTGYTLTGTTSATNAGVYQATATLEEGYEWDDGTNEPKTIDWKINKAAIKVTAPAGQTLTYNGKTQTGVASGDDYTLSGTTTATNAGSYTAKATLKTNDNYKYTWSDGTTAAKTISWKINKAANPLKVKPKIATVKFKKLKKKNQYLTVGKVITFKNKGKGTKTYKLVSAKKGKQDFKKKFTVNRKTGKVTVKKGLKKGTYKVKIKVTAAGNDNYRKVTKPVTVKIKVE